ncbi:MAG: hypothetical protein CL931_14385 [Deltaproteobacteria bacterium]|nr:hypothetical protein [Deltaproteobacteria bacterium]
MRASERPAFGRMELAMRSLPGLKALALALALRIAYPLPALAIGAVTDGGVTFGCAQNVDMRFGNTVNADFTGAFQWTRTIGVGSSEDFLVQFGSDAARQALETSLVPETAPGLLALLGLMGLASYGRKPPP